MCAHVRNARAHPQNFADTERESKRERLERTHKRVKIWFGADHTIYHPSKHPNKKGKVTCSRWCCGGTGKVYSILVPNIIALKIR